MSFDPRSFFSPDTDDAQLPPLLPPISLGAPLRPLPLEPSTQTDNDNLHNVKFSNLEPKALSQAQPTVKETPALPTHVDPAELRAHPRKLQKLDFYQLPKPSTSLFSTSTTNAASLPPILVLNDLHQPPPSAAQFPPITENEGSEQSQVAAPVRQDVSDITHTTDKNSDGTTGGTNWRKHKRVQARGRVQWTDQEIADLLEGVKKHGLGRWKSILNDEQFHFNPRRTAIDLKDRYRTSCMASDRAKNPPAESKKPVARRAQQRDAPPVPPILDQAEVQTRSIEQNLLHDLGDPFSKDSMSDESMGSLKFKFENYKIEDFEGLKGEVTCTLPDRNQGRFARWSLADDAKLERGFRKYGFKWSLIANDPEMGLHHRSAAQIRDRFRIKYPQNYKDNNPVLPESELDKDRNAQEIAGEVVENVPKARVPRNSGWQDFTDLIDDHTVTLPPLSKDLWKTVQPQDTVAPSGNAVRVRQVATAAIYVPNDATNWLNQEIGLDDEDARDINVDSLDDDLDFGGPLAPLRYPYDQDWTEEGFDSSLVLPPMMVFPPDPDEPQ